MLTMQKVSDIVIIEVDPSLVVLTISQDLKTLVEKAPHESLADDPVTRRHRWIRIDDLIRIRKDRLLLTSGPVKDRKHKRQAPDLVAIKYPSDSIIGTLIIARLRIENILSRIPGSVGNILGHKDDELRHIVGIGGEPFPLDEIHVHGGRKETVFDLLLAGLKAIGKNILTKGEDIDVAILDHLERAIIGVVLILKDDLPLIVREKCHLRDLGEILLVIPIYPITIKISDAGPRGKVIV